MIALSEKEIMIIVISQYCVIVEAAKIRFALTKLINQYEKHI